MGKNKHNPLNKYLPDGGHRDDGFNSSIDANIQQYGFPPLSKDFVRYMTYYYRHNYPTDFAQDQREDFSKSSYSRNKTNFQWLGTLESYNVFKPFIKEFLLEEKEGDIDALFLGIGYPSAHLQIDVKLSEIVYLFSELRNRRILGKSVLLQKLLSSHIVDQSGNLLNEGSIEQAIIRIDKRCHYPRKKDEIDEIIDRVIEANQKSG